ncbi:urea transporter [Vulgatibacter incomptus]|uniref:Eukaryotic-type low-affinity urea transporter n=1 Tax=Vulgatibacter incomptus TaxID=1391653 RepID=A0A0K1PFX2_9BACT|nr:urea transporter [Vulgatibacter incomptus]AKU92433.1 Eukaryotic-type low-affinity urea transporter [Vulgatibacter incomptus]
MRLSLNGRMPEWAERADRHQATAFVDSCLRGVGMVIFLDNPVTGILILVGLLVASPWLCVATLVGVASATLAARLLRLDVRTIRTGAYGYNGALVGAALGTFLLPVWSLPVFACIVLASAISPVVMVAVSAVTARLLDLPALTFPFNFVAIPSLLATFSIVHIHHSPLLAIHAAQKIETGLRATEGVTPQADPGVIVGAIFRGIGQVFLADDVVSGILIVAGLFVASRVVALFAVIGSVAGMLCGLALGGDGVAVYHGLWGYNSVLSSAALGGVFLVLRFRTAIYAVACAAATAVLYAAMVFVGSRFGVPALTLPFCIATVVFLLVPWATTSIRRVPLAEVSTPEERLRIGS